jgi:ribosome biogenesis GTPase A
MHLTCSFESFEKAEEYLKEVTQRPIGILLLIANKCDLHKNRVVTCTAGKLLATRFKAQFAEISCRNKQDVSDIFHYIGERLAGHNTVTLNYSKYSNMRISILQSRTLSDITIFT